MEDRCLEKLESILEEYSACLTYPLTRWALMKELVRKDRVTPALSRVNHRLEGTGLRLDFHFAPTTPSHGRASSSRPSMTEHWWRVPDVESIILSLDMDSDELDAWCEAAHNAREIERQIERHCQCKKKKAAAAEKAST